MGHNLELCTKEVEKFRHSLPGLSYGDLVFVDTPGFDDMSKSELDVLKMVDIWLKSTYVLVSVDHLQHGLKRYFKQIWEGYETERSALFPPDIRQSEGRHVFKNSGHV